MSQYDLEPIEYDMSPLDKHSTYDQFMSLRDTLVFSWKKYKGKAWSRLIVWEKEETVEIEWRNLFKLWFQSATDPIFPPEGLWPYVSYDTEVADIYWKISCIINKDWRYRIVHKEEVLPNANQTKVYCYVDIIRNAQYVVIWWVAVFDRQSSWTLTGSTSWTEPNWSCSVSFTLWKLFQKMTSFGYIERDLKAWDILVLRTKDSDPNPDWSPAWNDLILQANSNFFSVDYLSLPYNN